MQVASPNLTRNILLGLGLGIVFGSLLNILPQQTWLTLYIIEGGLDIGGKIFVKILQMMVIPVVFVSLVAGMCELGQQTKIGRLAFKTISLYICTTAIAISLAITFALLFNIGGHSALSMPTNAFTPPPAPGLKETLINIIPSNPIAAMANGKMLQILVFAMLLGAALAKSGNKGKRVAEFFIDLHEVVTHLILMLMNFAPIGVFCLVSHVFARFGFSMLHDLLGYFFTLLFVLLLHLIITNSLLLTLLAKVNPIPFFKKMFPVMVFGFSTSSSNATIPVTLETVNDRLGVHNFIASFSVPLGATINMDGTSIMQGVAAIFIAHIYHIDVGLSGYLIIILMATLASVGTAGIPGVGLITLSMVLTQVGLPVEGIALIMGVDRLLDMVRTAVNVTGDAAVACVIGRSENAFDEKIYAE